MKNPIPDPLDQLKVSDERRDEIMRYLNQVMQYPTNAIDSHHKGLQAITLLALTLRDLGQPRDFFGDIARFHIKFYQGYTGGPRELDPEELEFRKVCLREEVQEFEEAETLEKRFDALIDLVYFALGTAYRMGLPFPQGWDRVHAKNMMKVAANSGNPSKRGNFNEFDIVKPEGWEPPDLWDLVSSDPKPVKRVKPVEVSDE